MILVLVIAMPASARGQDSQATIIRAGFMIDGIDHSPRENVTIVIQDSRIAHYHIG